MTESADRGHTSIAQEQFGRQAALYVDSFSHATGESLAAIREYAARGRYRRAVDVGTGTGFTAFAVAPMSGEVVATDVTPEMLAEARRLGAAQGMANVRYALGAAEHLPFVDGSLDLVTCRTAAHHFQDVLRAIGEWRRVLEPGGILLLSDSVAPEDRELSRWMNDIEVRRDPSHTWNMTPSDWRRVLGEHGFAITDETMTKVYHEFDDWTGRSGTPAGEVERLRRDLLDAPPGAVDAFDIRQEDGRLRFFWGCLVLRARLESA